MNRPTPDPYLAQCPSRKLIEVIGNKWVLLVFPLLYKGPKRSSELLREIDGISQKMLTQTLRLLEQNGLVERCDYQEVPPRVDYRLTELGLSLGSLIGAVDDWVVDNFYATQGQ
ncbi:winged helix-turn-helix transcriptional regulator [Aliamphritea hakodatensis]|uniref:winged helix-turn-helix transcriptional regulator n=1 Tax=Aliamphritea hakodatensis TaxID=2895352 RepID=UPI0022FD77C0|nr:helix-turn-helix domain-containing protein [Aliamphritea hakodatensis]